jgi:hypothetical protein
MSLVRRPCLHCRMNGHCTLECGPHLFNTILRHPALFGAVARGGQHTCTCPLTEVAALIGVRANVLTAASPWVAM